MTATARDSALKCANMQPGDSVSGLLLLTSVERRTKKNGEPYFFLGLRDRTGSIQSVMWDNHDAVRDGRVAADDFVFVEGHVSEFNNSVQLTVREIQRVDDDKVDVSDFLAVSAIPRETMEAELDALIASVESTECRRLLDRFFGHDRFRDLFCTAPAAARIHQAWIGGLLEHTLCVMKTALHLGQQYQPFDRDLLVTGTLFHDVGKIREYSWRRSIGYTDEGRLLGHISIGASMIDGAIRALQREPEGFSEHYRTHILHLILSHHGKMEYGAPVVPKTKEALMLHYADYTEAYLASFQQVTDDAREQGQQWTGYNRMFESYLFVPPAANGAAGDIRSAIAAAPAAGGMDTHEKPADDVVLDDTP